MGKQMKSKNVNEFNFELPVFSFSIQQVWMGLLTFMVVYQFTMLTQLASVMTTYKSQLVLLERRLASAAIQLPELYDHTSVFKDPHNKYLKNIATESNDSRIPLDTSRAYTYDDFETVFQVKPLHVQVMTKEVAELLRDHDPNSDGAYIAYNGEVNYRQDEFTKYIDQGSHEAEDRERFEVKWVSVDSGFGLFAKKDLKESDIIGLYSGIITTDMSNTDYMWDYLTIEIKKKMVSLGVDSSLAGNYLRFVNHAGKQANSAVFLS
jgi:hypothetical protein